MDTERPRVWTLWLSVFMLLMAMGAGQTILLGILFFREAGEGRITVNLSDPTILKEQLETLALTPDAMLPLISVTTLSVLVIALLHAAFSPSRFRDRLGLHPSTVATPKVAAAIAACLGGAFALSEIIEQTDAGRSAAWMKLQAVLPRLSGGQFMIALLAIGIIAPIGEELFFRGVLLQRFRAAYGFWPGVLLSSVIFGAYHMDLMHSLFAFAFGLALALIAIRTGSIVPGIFAHMINNTASTLLARELGTQQRTTVSAVLIAVVGFAIAVVGTRYFVSQDAMRSAR